MKIETIENEAHFRPENNADVFHLGSLTAKISQSRKYEYQLNFNKAEGKPEECVSLILSMDSLMDILLR